MELEEMIKEMFLCNDNKKVKDETLDEYLNSFKNHELTRFAVTQVFVDKDYYNLYHIKNMNHKPKKYIMEYIKKNLEKILKCYIKIIKTNELDYLKTIIKNNNKEIKYGSLPLSIHFIHFLKVFSLAKVEYNKKKDTLKFFIPNEYIEFFNKFLSDKDLLKENRKNNKIFEYTENVLCTYGIIPLSKLHELFEKQVFKMNIEELKHVIDSFSFYEEIYLYNIDNDTLLCNIEFSDEDYAFNFYENQKGDYKKYSKEEFQSISSYKYIEKLKSYNTFIRYLCRNYDGITSDMDYIKEFIIYDYLSTAQTSINEADENFKINIVKMFDIDDIEIEKMLKMIKNIFNEYPKWIKRGNI